MKLKTTIFTLLTIVAVSCKKQTPRDWECTCDCKPIGGNSFTANTTIINQTQSDANETCTEFWKAKMQGNGTWKCTIK